MAKYNNQKAKILFLQQMLFETGENHTISMGEILERLLEKGIRAERKSIYDDMETLRYFGMDIQYTRERPAGYFLAGNIPAQSESESREPKEAVEELLKEDLDKEASDEIGILRNPCLALNTETNGKTMKLLCTERGKEEVQKYFGKEISIRNQPDSGYLAAVPLLEDPCFFGWLTAMGSEVHLQKPKKTAQAFRDYLKSLAREYKTDK